MKTSRGSHWELRKTLIPWSITQGAAPKRGNRLALASFAFWERKGGIGPFRGGTQDLGALYPICIPFSGWGLLHRQGLWVTSGKLSSSSFDFFPMYVNSGPRFRTIGAEVSSVVKIKHLYTTFT